MRQNRLEKPTNSSLSKYEELETDESAFIEQDMN